LPRIVLIFIFSLLAFDVVAKEITTNDVTMSNAPDWLKQPRVERVTDRIKTRLEGYATKKTPVSFYNTQEAYDQVQPYGAMSLAVTKYDGGAPAVYIGPQVDDKNFDEVFGHELVHVWVYQKYKGAVPKWLEEGMANFFSSKKKVDYKWLASKSLPEDVHTLAHPFSGSSSEVQYRYVASQAFAEMLAKKCDLEELLRLSVTRKMEDYMKSYCEIKDLNQAFKDWVKKKAAN